jgi:hypothetical protein
MSGVAQFLNENQRVLFVDAPLDDAARATLSARVGNANLLEFDANALQSSNQFDTIVLGNSTALP